MRLGGAKVFAPPGNGIDCAINGTVTDIKNFESVYGRKTARLSVKASAYDIETSVKNRGALKSVFVDCPADHIKKCNISPGSFIAAKGRLKDFSEATNPGQFDSRRYYRNHGYSGIIESDKLYTLKPSFVHKILWFIPVNLWSFRSHIKENFYRILDEDEAGILTAMLLGDKSGLSEDTKKLYQENSISHLLSISGLHVSLIGAAVLSLLRRLKCSYSASLIISILFLVIYGILTGFSVSTSRAVIMMCISLLAGILGKSYDLKSALCISAVVILLQNPALIFETGFQLSFLAVIGISYICPELKFLLNGLKPVKKEKKPKNENIKEWICRVVKKSVIESLIISTGIQIVSFPVLLYSFYEITMSGFFLNLIVIPLMSILVITGFAGGIISIFALTPAAFVLGSSHFILEFYHFLCVIGKSIPHNAFILGKPSLLQIAVYYFFIILIFYTLSVMRRNEELKEMWTVCHGENSKPPFPVSLPLKKELVYALLIFSFFILTVRAREFRVTMLDVGQGDGFVIENGRGNTYISDFGSTSKKNTGKYILVPFLKSQGIGRVDAVFISHTDKDHILGILELLTDKSIKVKRIILSEPVAREAENIANGSYSENDDMYSEELDRLLSLCKERRIPLSGFAYGNKVVDSAISFTALYPFSDTVTSDVNEASIVMRLDAENFSMLFTGDAGKEAEEVMLNRLQNTEDIKLIDTDVLKVGHHGSKNSSTESFLHCVSPRLSLISCGLDNSYGHPHEETLEKLQNVHTVIRRTDKEGCIQITVSKKGIRAVQAR